MLTFEGKEGITFDWVNIIDFWLVEFTLVKTKDTFEDKFVGWMKDDLKKYLYKHLCIITFTIIFKYSMIKIEMPKKNIYSQSLSWYIQS